MFQKKGTVAINENHNTQNSVEGNIVSNSGTDGTPGTKDGLVKGAALTLNGDSARLGKVKT
jgi:hypothetical protein